MPPNKLMPHGDWFGKNLGIAMEDEESGQLTPDLQYAGDHGDQPFR